ncbi:helix-turn-helix domain-containing protein [uncultured Methanomethylovorans sp.]|uniref:TrmB family transcriptional regulator n=1 Tax=uncultured Methanomethylovorans sp. TaxID=183759 RepID=UPI002AA7400B|nr:helix-turn-helix domain-containing protein [uncultured Methanomethylovorans sp.]
MSSLIDSLRNLGFTEYEAKVFVALTRYGSGTATDLHMFSGIPRPAVYGVLRKLAERGLIEVQHTKPMRYKCICPQKTIEKIKTDFEQETESALEKLEEVYSSKDNEIQEEVVWTINGLKNVTDRIIQVICNAKSEIIAETPHPGFKDLENVYLLIEKHHKELAEVFNRKISEGVKVRIIAYSSEELGDIAKQIPGAELRLYAIKDEQFRKGGAILVDSSEVLIDLRKDAGVKEELTAIWSNGREFVFFVKHLLEAEWEAAHTNLN